MLGGRSLTVREYIDPMLFSALVARVPSQCLVCHRWPARAVCLACEQRFARPLPRCRSCALPVTGGVAQCGACVRDGPLLDACVAALDYAYPWSTVLARFKFNGEPGLARLLARLLLDAPGAAELVAQSDAVLPMPLSSERLKERGFNQSLELARRLGADGRLYSDWLLRPLHRPAQSTLPLLADRLRNVSGVFAVDPLVAPRLVGKRVVLVDDVMTSGASLKAAAQVLRAAGAASVGALVVARTP